MRFSLAAAALLMPSCSSLPSSLAQNNIMEIKSKLLMMENVQQHTSHFPLLQRTLMMDKRMKQRDQPPARRTKEECDPDVGILDCSVGMFCQPDEGSLLGGVCTWDSDQRRKLAVSPDVLDFFDNLACGAYAQYYPFCNCDDWDINTHTGTGTCYNTEWVLCHHCGGDSFCASSNKSVFQTDGYNSTSTACAYFTDPYEQTICFTYYYGTTACKFEVDGVACTSCESAGQAINPVQFDCENVGMGSGTRFWSAIVPPGTKEACGDSYVSLYDFCFLCPNGLPLSDAQPNVPGYNFDSCFQLRTVAERGYFNETTCNYLQTAVQETCCGVLPEPFHCDICGMNDSYITEFNNTIEVNGTAMSCEDILFASENGWISKSECGYIPALVADTCVCTHLTDGGNLTGSDNTTSFPSTTTSEETEAPTMSPGTVAPTDSASVPKTSLSSLPFVIPLAVGIYMMFCSN